MGKELKVVYRVKEKPLGKCGQWVKGEKEVARQTQKGVIMKNEREWEGAVKAERK